MCMLVAACPPRPAPQDTAFRVFHVADYTADWLIINASHFYNSNLKGFEHTFDHLLRNLEHRVHLLKVGVRASRAAGA